MTYYNSGYEQCFPFSDEAPQYALAASTALTYTVPGTANERFRVSFSYPYNANVYVAINATATLPAIATMNSSSRSEFRPTVRYVKGGDTLSFISTSTVTDGGFSLLRLPSSN